MTGIRFRDDSVRPVANALERRAGRFVRYRRLSFDAKTGSRKEASARMKMETGGNFDGNAKGLEEGFEG